MNKINKFISIILLASIPFVSLGQEISREIELLDFKSNLSKIIKIKEDWANSCTYIINMASFDSIKITNVTEIDSISIISHKFLKIIFRIRSGSGGHIRMTKIFSISSDLIYESLTLFTCRNEYLLTENKSEKYKIEINLSNVGHAFQIILKEEKRIYFKNIYQKAKSWSKVYILNFNEENMLFYDTIVVNCQIIICDYFKMISDNYFKLNLKNDLYINYKGIWYVKNKSCYSKI